MNSEFKLIMEEYIECVNSVCLNLIEGLNLRTKWDLREYMAAHHKMEFEINGISYRFHGRGCMAFNEEMFIDWDFGYRSRWCGIEPWILARTLEYNKSNHIKYYDGKRIKEECEQAVLYGDMFKKYNMYYFTIPIVDTFEPNFPKEFDTLIVEYFDSKWIIPRNKVIDRFIRKSKRIYNQIEKSQNKYVLRFMFNGEEIYSIPYDDIGYPENAVKIMSDDILRNTDKESK